jgi:superfamily II DNA/RNA helicase
MPEPESRAARSFSELGVSAALVEALATAGITEPFPVQQMTIPDALAGRDVAGKAPTGSGKTLAFGIPIIERLQRSLPRRPRSLVLAPTRELAKQICDALVPLARSRALRVHAFYGGAPFESQIRALDRGVDIAVACPGRLLDLVGQELVSLSDVEIVVVDEADRMADMGFLPDVRALLELTRPDKQTLLFSATLDGDVDVLIAEHQHDPVRHQVETPDDGPIRHLFWTVDEADRAALLIDLIRHVGRTLVFARTRYGAERISDRLEAAGVRTAALHGGNSQLKREAALDDFRSGRIQALVATDVAARGIHVDDIPCVVQYELSTDAKDFVHRSGRTGRAGAVGTVVSFVTRGQRRLAERIIDEAGIDAEVERADVHQLESAAERIAIDREIAALTDIRRPGAVGSVCYQLNK